jgi:arabinogalactan endo-1,4-beta-galactosidase
MRKHILFLLFIGLLSCNKSNSGGSGVIPPPPAPAIIAKGADISWLTQMETAGKVFYNGSGAAQDCIQILKNLGMNSIRLRVWVNPAGGWNNTADVLVKATRAKNLGMKILIDFHYSDSWADPVSKINRHGRRRILQPPNFCL